jgi:hypothetical protein
MYCVFSVYQSRISPLANERLVIQKGKNKRIQIHSELPLDSRSLAHLTLSSDRSTAIATIRKRLILIRFAEMWCTFLIDNVLSFMHLLLFGSLEFTLAGQSLRCLAFSLSVFIFQSQNSARICRFLHLPQTWASTSVLNYVNIVFLCFWSIRIKVFEFRAISEG